MIDNLELQLQARWAKVTSGWQAEWEFAVFLAEQRAIHGEQLTALAASTCNLARGTVQKYCRLGEHWLALPEEQRTDWGATSPWVAIEALPMAVDDPVGALELVKSGRTQRAVRAKALAADPDQHSTAEWRTLKLTVTKDTLNDWRLAVERLRLKFGEMTDDDLVTAVVQLVMQAPELESDVQIPWEGDATITDAN